jgi:hypothetical protein
LFLFELALELGFPHPRHLLQQLTSQDVTDWLMFARHRPFGYNRFAWMFGTLASQVHNVNKTSSSRSREWQDFFPVKVRLAGTGNVLTPEEAIEMFKQYNVERGYPVDGRKTR